MSAIRDAHSSAHSNAPPTVALGLRHWRCWALGASLCIGLLDLAGATAAPPAAHPPGAAAMALEVTDDEGAQVRMPKAAQRIISLAPHTTELLFAAGAGAKVVATVRYADFPPAARRLPLVGDAYALDLERIAALQPDLIVAWSGGTSPAQMARLRSLRVPIFQSAPHNLLQIASSFRRLGLLAGAGEAGERAASAFEAKANALQARFSQQPPLRVFYQIWHQPLMTVNREHLISEVIRLCGGNNVFASQSALVPTVSLESVLAARPQVLVTAVGAGEAETDRALSGWSSFEHFEPTARHQFVLLPGDLISRQGPRILDAAEQLCSALEAIRASAR